MTQQLTDMLRLRSSYKTTFTTPDGQRVLRHLMKVGFITSCPFVAGDPHQTSLNIGCQRIVQSILKFVYGSDDAIKQAIEQTHQSEL